MSTDSVKPADSEAEGASSADPFTDHEYDGIKEYDNPMPRWWVWTFWGTFYFAFCYFMWQHVYERGTPVEEEWAAEMRTAREEAARRDLGTISEDSLAKLGANTAMMADARVTFGKRCVQCHGTNGEGVIGPNLTDDYWLHGTASLMDIHGVIHSGVTAKGMPAWGKQLDPVEVAKLAAYVGTFRGKHVQGKPPEGTLLASAAAAAPAAR